ncbi:MAG: hypothetical protein RL653_1698 [Pseudomonadota bacterium]
MEKGNQKIVGLGGKLPVQDADEFAKRFGPSLSRGGIYLRTKQFVAPGTPVLLDLKRADGQSLLRCRGKVEFITGHDGQGTPGLGIRFLVVDPSSRAVLDTVLAGRPGAAEDSPPVPNGVGPLHYRLEPARPQPPAGASVLSAREVGELFHVGLPQGQWMPVGEPRREEPAPSAAALQSLRQELSFELRALRRQAARWMALAGLSVVVAFAGGYLAARATPTPGPVAVPVGQAAASQAPPQQEAPVRIAAAAPAEEDPMADFEPAVEEELTAEESARMQEVLSATAERPARKVTPAPATSRKPAPPAEASPRKPREPASPRTAATVRPDAAPAPRPAPVAAAPGAPAVEAVDVDPEEAQVVREALAAPRGGACRERMDALTQLVARTRLPAHREAGILLRARCLSDTWKVEEARAEYGRYLREFPAGTYAAEASRVLAQ